MKPKIISKTIITIIVLCIAVVIICWYLYNLYLGFWVPDQIKNIGKIRAQVLYHTDHEELLKVCRKKIADYNEFMTDQYVNGDDNQAIVHKPGEFESNKEQQYDPGMDPKRRLDRYRLSDINILGLDVTFAYVYRDRMDLELCTAFYSVSLQVFAEGVKECGDMMIIEGLWYNDVGFQKHSNFSEYLEKLGKSQEGK